MPHGDERSDVVRRLQGVAGTVRLRHEWMVRLDYGEVLPWVRRASIGDEAVIEAIGGPDRLVLRGPRLPRATDHRHTDEFDVAEGETLTFSTTWLPSHVPLDTLSSEVGLDVRIDAGIAHDERWAAQCPVTIPHHDVVRRSLITLRLMTHHETGGIVAAPTTSLPEDPGGERNWDYRYCWLRDAALTLDSLLRAGYTDEAQLWRGWLLRTLAGDPQDLQILYAVDGSRRLPELTLDHLPGYADSRPVRIGNGAALQRQLDVVGEVMMSLEHTRQATGRADADAWALQRALVDNLAKTWEEPDHGLWEIRGPQQRFTHSQAMVWAAFDRAVRARRGVRPARPGRALARAA